MKNNITDEDKEELIELVKDCNFPNRQREELINYIHNGEYPKDKSNQITFYLGYRKIRLITRLGTRLRELGLIKK